MCASACLFLYNEEQEREAKTKKDKVKGKVKGKADKNGLKDRDGSGEDKAKKVKAKDKDCSRIFFTVCHFHSRTSSFAWRDILQLTVMHVLSLRIRRVSMIAKDTAGPAFKTRHLVLPDQKQAFPLKLVDIHTPLCLHPMNLCRKGDMHVRRV